MSLTKREFIISRSEKAIQNLQKELKKLNPSGASQRQLFARSKLLKAKNDIVLKQKYNHIDRFMVKKMPKLETLKKNDANDIHIRSPVNIEEQRRRSTLSPDRILKDMRKISPGFYSPDPLPSHLLRFYSEEIENIERANQNLEVVNDIIEACDKISSPDKRNLLPKVLKHYTKKITNIVDGIELQINKSRRNSKEYDLYRNHDILRHVQEEHKIIDEFRQKDLRRKMLEAEYVNANVQGDSSKKRRFSSSKPIEQFMRKEAQL